MKPIDFQVTIPRTMDASKMQNELHQRNYINQQHTSYLVQKQGEESTRKINSVNKSFEGKIKEKQEERKKFQQEGHGGKRRKNKKERKKSSNNHIIDILI